jgi:hypothetical protein
MADTGESFLAAERSENAARRPSALLEWSRSWHFQPRPIPGAQVPNPLPKHGRAFCGGQRRSAGWQPRWAPSPAADPGNAARADCQDRRVSPRPLRGRAAIELSMPELRVAAQPRSCAEAADIPQKGRSRRWVCCPRTKRPRCILGLDTHSTSQPVFRRRPRRSSVRAAHPPRKTGLRALGVDFRGMPLLRPRDPVTTKAEAIRGHLARSAWLSIPAQTR